jgi:hypothetical protein
MWAKWVMRVLAGVYIVGGVVSLFLPGPLKHCYASSGGDLSRPQDAVRGSYKTFVHQAVSSCVPQRNGKTP